MAKKRKLQKAPSLRNARNPRSEASGRRKALLSERARVPARRNARRFLRKLYRGNQRKKAVKKEAKIEAGSGKDREIEKYEVTADGITAGITITENGGEKRYNVKIQDFSFITKALLAEIRNSIVSEVLVSSTEVLDPTALEGLKKKFREKAEQLITEKVPLIKSATTNLLVGRLMQEMLGLDRIEFLLADIDLEEIVLTSVGEPIRVFHKKYGWTVTNIHPKSEEEIINFSNIIARRVGRQITTLNPLLDAHLTTGDRANAVLYPISTKGNTITIRKFRRDPWTITDLIKNGSCTADVFALLWLAIEYEMTILFSGGTATGKTTFLNVCMPFIPINHRIVSIEDTRELLLPETLYWAPLVTRQPNPEGKGEVTMLDLLVNSLRMRPDRIIVGEIRRQREAEVLFEAMHTGHSVYATLHADTAAETISRLTHPPINVPPNLLDAVNLNVVLFRDRKKGIRRVLQVAELIVDENKVTPNILYRFKPSEDKIIEHAKSLKFYDEITRYTGMSFQEITKDLSERKVILMWMVKSNIRSIGEISRVMTLYYSDRKKLLDAANKNRKLSSL
ncbi:MAG TPA: CpaF family protein [Nanoarchaeota archaeon]|nr:CpaF family protein [Nanoarchaeota archaeon]HIH65844.1 CpaF family protein [Nanoarchaeota archaeon]